MKSILFCLSLVLGGIHAAAASIITFEFEAVLSRVTGPSLPGTLTQTASTFSTITGSFGFDLNAATDPGNGGIGTAYLTGSLIVNEFDVSGALGPINTVVFDNVFNIDGVSIASPEMASVAGFFDRVELLIADDSGTAISNEDLPNMVSFANFNRATLRFEPVVAELTSVGVLTGPRGGLVDFEFTSLSQVNAVPVPSVLVLWLSAFAFMMLSRHKAKRENNRLSPQTVFPQSQFVK